MKMSGGPASVNYKVSLLLIAMLIAGATLFYTQNLVSKLQKTERQIVLLYARGIEYVANSTPNNDISFLFDNIIKPINFPLILTDSKNQVNLESKTDIRNIDFDSTLSKTELLKIFTQKLKDMDDINPPINVTYQDTIILQKIHYGDSALINTLKFYPYLQILFASLFFLVGFRGFRNIKKKKQRNIGVGKKKKTAHQFGTPISSLMGWLEMLKGNYSNPDKVLDLADEIENDVEKLSKITHRFSKIGSIQIGRAHV